MEQLTPSSKNYKNYINKNQVEILNENWSTLSLKLKNAEM